MCGRGGSFISFFLKSNPFIDSMQFHKEIESMSSPINLRGLIVFN